MLLKIYRIISFGRQQNTIENLQNYQFWELVPPNKSDKSSPKIEADGAFLTDVEVDAALCDPLAVPLP